MAQFEGLLPDNYDDFRSQNFWDGFFKKRGSVPFEWYGEWPQLRPLSLDLCKGKQILMVGCGNSELSAQMYDDGCQDITNIDFSKPVVREMMVKHLRQRPRMKWLVMDMTRLTFKDEEFEVVFDKGALDALMGTDNAAAVEAGVKLLAEVQRVLSSERGTYICVTLAQVHVLSTLLAAFDGGEWQTVMHKLPPTPDMASSPLQPYLVVVRRHGPDSEGAESAVEATFSEAPGVIDSQHISEVLQVIKSHNESAQAAGSAAAASSAALPSDRFAELHLGRRLTVQLPLKRNAGTNGAAPAEAPGQFTAVVLDVESQAVARAQLETAVFVVPQGREHEHLFAAEEGQWSVAEQCGARRVILVSVNRGHAVASLAALQKQLSPLVLGLATARARKLCAEQPIPFLSTDDGVGRRQLVAEAHSHLTGGILVEDVELHEDDAQGRSVAKALRRMIFTSNRALIQSEALLMPEPSTGAAAPPPTKPEAAGRSSSRKKAPAPAANQNSSSGAARRMVVDHSRLPCDYHVAMVAGLSLIGGRLEEAGRRGGLGRALVVGLGGGGLPTFLHRHCGLHVETVELDPVVADLAQRHFGLQQADHLKVLVGDGLKLVADLAAAAAADPATRVDAMLVDAGSGDAALAMSCPPAAFLEPPFLQAARTALSPGGLLAVNCVSRSEAPYKAAVKALQDTFAEVYEINVDTDVNRVLVALPQPRSALAAKPIQAITMRKLDSKEAQEDMQELGFLLEHRLQLLT